MPSRRPSLARRLLRQADDVVSRRAPGLSERAYRATAPLRGADPLGAAAVAQQRLDRLRDEVVAKAARGRRVTKADRRRYERDLRRTALDLEHLAEHLPAVRARVLALRVSAYTDALAALDGASPAAGRHARARDVLLLGGAAATTSVAVFASLPLVADGGLLAASACGIGAVAFTRRRERKGLAAAVADHLVAVDRATTSSGGTGVTELDAARRDLVRRAAQSGRLGRDGRETLRRIDAVLDDLLIRLVDGDLEPQAAHLVHASITRYLPDTLDPILTAADPTAKVAGRPLADEVAEQLAVIEGGLARVAAGVARSRPETQLLLQGEFLRSKFGRSGL